MKTCKSGGDALEKRENSLQKTWDRERMHGKTWTVIKTRKHCRSGDGKEKEKWSITCCCTERRRISMLTSFLRMRTFLFVF